MGAKRIFPVVLILFLLSLVLQGCAVSKAAISQGSSPQSTNPVLSSAIEDDSSPQALPQAETQKWIPSQGEFPFPTKGVPILYYHSIANLPGNELRVPPEKFEEQMKYLRDSGYTVISLDQLLNAYQSQEKLPQKPVVITFDDGYPDNYSIAFPILKQYNYTATFFVVTSYMEPNQGMLSWDQLKEMLDYGMTIAPHTVNHSDLSQLPLARQREEIFGSKTALESKLGITTEFFCYPYGGFNKTTLDLLKESGFKLAVTTGSGNAKQGDNLYLLKRIYVNGLKDITEFKRKLSQ